MRVQCTQTHGLGYFWFLGNRVTEHRKRSNYTIINFMGRAPQ